MAKIHIKSEKLTPFGGIFPITEQLSICFFVPLRVNYKSANA